MLIRIVTDEFCCVIVKFELRVVELIRMVINQCEFVFVTVVSMTEKVC